MQAELSRRVIKTLAAQFNLPLANTAMPGTTLIPDDECTPHSWITLWPVGQRIVAKVAPGLMPQLQQIVAGCADGHCLKIADLQRTWPEMDSEAQKVYFLNPKDCVSSVPDTRFTIRQLTQADAPAFNAFQARCAPEEIQEGEVALDHETAFGVLDGDRVVAGASVFEWYGFKDIGIITDPDYRRMGLGKALVAALCNHYSTLTGVVLYRHLISNTGSQRIAEGLGFEYYATIESVRLRPVT